VWFNCRPKTVVSLGGDLAFGAVAGAIRDSAAPRGGSAYQT
jgi:hypothetical protein